MHLPSQDSEPLCRSSRGRLRSTDPPGELEGQGRDIGALVELLKNHSAAFFGGRGHGKWCIFKASITWDDSVAVESSSLLYK